MAEITFEVLSQKKIVESTFADGGYIHELEIKPFSLGIEGLPEISRISFAFTPGGGDSIPGGKSLKFTWLYKHSILTESVGKTFTMKVRQWNQGARHIDIKTMRFDTEEEFDLDNFREKNSEDSPNNFPPAYNTLKEKILRNLDKIGLDPLGNFANSQAIEKYWTWGEYYDTGEAKKNGQYKITDQNGEEIDLRESSGFEGENWWKFYKEIRAAIIDSIEQNPTDWEICSDGSDSQRGNFLKNKKTGVKHYKSGFTILIDRTNGGWDDEAGAKEWDKIEVILKNSFVSIPQQLGSQKPKKDPNTNSKTLKTVLIVSGIVGGLILIILVFYFWKRKKDCSP